MKTFAFVIVATFLTLGLLTYLYVEHLQDKDSIRLKESELKMLRRENLEIRKNYELRGDSLQNVFTLLSLRSDTIKVAAKVTKQTLTDHEKITFVRSASDSVRHRKLNKLYTSYALDRN